MPRNWSARLGFWLLMGAAVPALQGSVIAQNRIYRPYYPLMPNYYNSLGVGPGYVPSTFPVYPATKNPNANLSDRATSRATYGNGKAEQDRKPDYYSEDYSGDPKTPGANNINTARIRVRLPADAELWFDDAKLSQRGSEREVVTPTLKPDRVYSYHVRARWVENDGIEVEKSLKVKAFAGIRVTVNFVHAPPQAISLQPPPPVLSVQPSSAPPLPSPEPSPSAWRVGSP